MISAKNLINKSFTLNAEHAAKWNINNQPFKIYNVDDKWVYYYRAKPQIANVNVMSKTKLKIAVVLEYIQTGFWIIQD